MQFKGVKSISDLSFELEINYCLNTQQGHLYSNLVPRIMLVDDDLDHLKLFTMILREKGFLVDVFSDSAAALLKFKPHYYDLLVLDYRMPNLNGLELYRIIKRMEPGVKAILVTASHEQLSEGKQSKEDHIRVITRPVTNEKFLEEIGSLFTTSYLKGSR